MTAGHGGATPGTGARQLPHLRRSIATAELRQQQAFALEAELTEIDVKWRCAIGIGSAMKPLLRSFGRRGRDHVGYGAACKGRDQLSSANGKLLFPLVFR